ncbi:hypothetical protein INR49_024467, partial [Caranx melampygus]
MTEQEHLHSSDTVAVGLVAISLGVVESLHLLLAGPPVSGLLFPSQWADHGDEERLLKQGHHSADHGLETCQGAKV